MKLKSDNKKALLLYLAVILIIAALLRFYEIDFGKPNLYHPDEIKLTAQAGRLLATKFMDKEAFFGIRVYPPFYTYILSGVLAFFIFIGLLTGRFESLKMVQSAFESNPFDFFLASRITVALLGVLTVLILYKLCKKLYSPKIALISSLLLAINFLHIRNSHFGTVDVPATFLGVLALYGCSLILVERKTRYYIFSAIIIACAVATKFSMFFLALPLFYAHFAMAHKNQYLKFITDKRIWISIVTGVVAFIIACPLFLLDFSETWGGIVGTHRFEQVGKIGSGGGFLSYWTGDQAPGFGVFFPNSIPGTFGLLLMGLSIAGIIYLLVRHKKQDLLILLFVVPTYLLLEKVSIKAMRHFLPLTPFFILFATVAITSLAAWLKNKKIQTVFYFVIIGFIIINQVSKTLAYHNALAKIDPRTHAMDWIVKNIPKQSKVVVEDFPPSNLNDDSKHPYKVYKTEWFSKSMKKSHDFFTFVAESDSFYYISDDFTRQVFDWKLSKTKYPEIVKDRQQIFEWLKTNTILSKEFSSNDMYVQPGITIYKYKK